MEYFIHLIILFSIYAILALGLNLVTGYTGLLSVTHAAFYGVGAYATAILLTRYGMNFFLSVVVGIALACLLGLLIGVVLSRFDGDYYALASLGFNSIIFGAFLNWQELTRGPLGIPGIPRPGLFGFQFSSNLSYLVMAIVIVMIAFALSRFIAKSSFGRVLKAIREDEKATQVFGYNTPHYKLAIFIVGAGMAAVAGSLVASYITFIDPAMFTINESIFILAIIILGGLANLQGSLLGALFLTLLPELLRFVGFPSEIAAHMRQAVYGLLLILLMRYRPQGLVGEFRM